MEERDSLEQRLYVSFCMHTQYNQSNDVGLSERWGLGVVWRDNCCKAAALKSEVAFSAFNVQYTILSLSNG